jgi:crotonobetainyl-CoA:carnitine CoA-transferase CaiB-like acyl-CoA transferase
MALIGREGDERFSSFAGRVAHREEVEDALAAWIAERTADEVLATFEEAHAAAAPVYDLADIVDDPHYRARGAITEVDGVPMQALVARLSATPGRIRWAGRPLGADTEEILAELDGESSSRK